MSAKFWTDTRSYSAAITRKPESGRLDFAAVQSNAAPFAEVAMGFWDIHRRQIVYAGILAYLVAFWTLFGYCAYAVLR